MKKIKKWYSGQTTRAEYIKYMVATAILFLVNYALFFLLLSMESESFLQLTEILFNPFLAAILAVPLFIFYSGLYIRRTRNMINSSSEAEVYLMALLCFIFSFLPIISTAILLGYCFLPEGIDKSSIWKQHIKPILNSLKVKVCEIK